MNTKYRVVFLGLLSSETNFKTKMREFGVLPEQVSLIIKKAPIILKDEISYEYARLYADAVQSAGGNVEIWERSARLKKTVKDQSIVIKSLKAFIMCPECGYKQLKKEACVRCGLVYNKRSLR